MFEQSLNEIKYNALSGILNRADTDNVSLEYEFWSTLLLGLGQGALVPAGGTTGQFLAKTSNTNYDVQWVTGSGGGGSSVWGSITGTLSAQTDLQTALNGKENIGVAASLITTHEGLSDPHPQYLTVTEGNATYAILSHTHTIANVTGLQAALDGKQPSGSYAAVAHTHTQADITGLVAALSGKEPTIASGTTSDFWRGDKTFVAITKTTVGLGNVDNTSDVNKPVSTAVTTALGNKQDTLVSGTTLKTVNGNTLLGSGNLVISGGGGGTPGGNVGELQFNNAGAFDGAANLEVDGGNLKLIATTDPATPTGGLLFYAKSVANRILPKIIGPSGIDTVLQVGLHGNAIFMVAPASGTTAPTAWGGSLTTSTTMSVVQTIASANPWLAVWRKRWTSAATAASNTGMRTAYTRWFRGNAAGFGGFFFRTQFSHGTNLNGSQAFIGLCASTGALASTAGAVSALLNMIGVGYDTTDANTGNWFLLRNDGTGTAVKVDLGANALRSNLSFGYDLIIYNAPNSGDFYVRIVNLHTNVVVLDTVYNTDVPLANTGMALKAEMNNGAVAAATTLDVAKVYIESDY